MDEKPAIFSHLYGKSIPMMVKISCKKHVNLVICIYVGIFSKDILH